MIAFFSSSPSLLPRLSPRVRLFRPTDLALLSYRPVIHSEPPPRLRLRQSTSEASSTASDYLSQFLSKPKYWVSSLGLVNSLLLGGLGLFAYTRREQIKNADRRVLTAGAVGLVAVLGGQSYFATDKVLKQTKSDKPKSK